MPNEPKSVRNRCEGRATGGQLSALASQGMGGGAMLQTREPPTDYRSDSQRKKIILLSLSKSAEAANQSALIARN